MKTLNELYTEIIGSDELKGAYLEAVKGGKVSQFLKANGCGATAEEVAAFLKKKTGAQLSEKELDSVASGACNDQTTSETLASIFTVGLICALGAVVSASEGHVGQREDDEGRICNSGS